MPRATLSMSRIRGMLPGRITDAQLEEFLFQSKAELEGREGDSLSISATPDRLDLLSESGLARQLAGRLRPGRRPPRPAVVHGGVRFVVRAERSVDPLRPWIAGVVVRSGAGIDAATLEEAIRYQELLHATIGQDRRAASLGLYALERIRSPLHYGLEPMAEVEFTPLGSEAPTSAARFFAEHAMAARYGAYGRAGERCLVLRDADGKVLSLPPILNARPAGEVRAGDREILIESTGTGERRVAESVGLFLSVFAGQGFSVAPVAIEGPGSRRSDGRSIYAPRAFPVPSALVASTLGTRLAPSEVPRLAAAAGLSAAPRRGGWTVEAPPWRPDLLAPIDIVEDLVIARGVGPEDGLLLPSVTRGKRLRESVFRRRVANLLLGLGFTLLHRPVLVSDAAAQRVAAPGVIRVANPPSEEYAVVRSSLLVSLLEVLRRNARHAHPQRLGEVGPVVVRDPSAESGSETRYRAGVVIAEESAGFADAAAFVDYALRALGAIGVREGAEIAGTIPGRAARVRIAGSVVAELGEVAPALLAEIKVPVPVAWAELDLSALWPLFSEGPGSRGKGL